MKNTNRDEQLQFKYLVIILILAIIISSVAIFVDCVLDVEAGNGLDKLAKPPITAFYVEHNWRGEWKYIYVVGQHGNIYRQAVDDSLKTKPVLLGNFWGADSANNPYFFSKEKKNENRIKPISNR